MNLPLSLPLIGSVGPITLEIDNLLSSNPMTTGSFPSISDAFSNLDLVGQLNVLVDGLDLALGGISDVLSGEILGLSLPLVGDNLKRTIDLNRELGNRFPIIAADKHGNVAKDTAADHAPLAGPVHGVRRGKVAVQGRAQPSPGVGPAPAATVAPCPAHC